MRTSPNYQKPMDDGDDIFGPPRNYPTSFSARNRPPMISSKYRLKEERRKLLKLTMNKLKKIDDPEANLCRSVLINNTMKRLQQENKDDKVLSYSYGNDSYLNLKSEFLRQQKSDFTSDEKMEEIENDFHTRLEEEINNVSTSEAKPDVAPPSTGSKRVFDDMVDDYDVHDVLSQFYMPPTPRMLTAIDDDDEEDPLTKRLKLDEEVTTSSFVNNNIPRFSNDSENYTCGQASMFGEMQTTVYHSLITSLET